jgi:hypothetical protein
MAHVILTFEPIELVAFSTGTYFLIESVTISDLLEGIYRSYLQLPGRIKVDVSVL